MLSEIEIFKYGEGVCGENNGEVTIYDSISGKRYDLTDPDLEWLQCIGILDTKEEKLFEGDVVEYKDGDEKKRAKITYSNYTASFRLENITGYKSAMDIPFHIWNGRGDMTKIGNVHENPELEE